MRINPALLLEAAKMSGIRTEIMDGKVIIVRPPILGFEHCDALEPWPKLTYDPLTIDSYAWALERALKDKESGGWSFGKDYLGRYQAIGTRFELFDESGTMLLLKCVSAQTGIPVWVDAL